MPSLSSILSVSVPVLALAACGDNLSPDGDAQGAVEGVVDESTISGPEVTPRPLNGFIGFAHPDCDRASISYEAVVHYHDDMSPVPNLQCHFRFDDNTESFDCNGVHEFATAGTHQVTMAVTDPDYGAALFVETTTIVYAPGIVSVAAEAPECGLELSWTSVRDASGETRYEISPADQVVGLNGPLPSAGTVQVTAPGTYTVSIEVEDERRLGPICQYTASSSVEVRACPHQHEPDCGH